MLSQVFATRLSASLEDQPLAADRLFTALAFITILTGAGALQGCAVTSVAGAAVGVTGAAIGATAKVATTAVGVGAGAVGAAGKAVTGGH